MQPQFYSFKGANLKIGEISWRLVVAGAFTLPFNAIFVLPLWGIALLLYLREERPKLEHLGMKWLALISVGLLLVTGLSYRLEISLGGLFNYLPFFLFFWLITRLVNSPARLQELLHWNLAAAAVTGLAGSIEWITGINWQWKLLGAIEFTLGSQAEGGIVMDRVTSFFFWPTSAAGYFVLVLPVLLAWGLAKHPWGWLGGLVTAIALVGTASRNAWATSIVSLGILLVAARQWLVMVLLGVGVGTILTAGLAPVTVPGIPQLRQVVPELLWRKVIDTVNPQVQGYASTSERFEAWDIALQMISARPLTGWGPQTFAYVGVDVYQKKALTIHAHNLYLTYGAELGIPLAMVLVSFLVWSLVRAGRSLSLLPDEPRWWAIGLIAAMVSYLLFGCFDVVFNESRVNAQLWLWMALLWQFPNLYPPLPDPWPVTKEDKSNHL